MNDLTHSLMSIIERHRSRLRYRETNLSRQLTRHTHTLRNPNKPMVDPTYLQNGIDLTKTLKTKGLAHEDELQRPLAYTRLIHSNLLWDIERRPQVVCIHC